MLSEIKNTKEMLDVLEKFVNKYNLQDFLQIDHIGFVCENAEIFDVERKYWEDKSKFIYQNITSRRNAKVKLKEKIQTIIGECDLLEIADYKNGTKPETRYDHLEIVPKNISYEDLVLKMQNLEINLKEVVLKRKDNFDHITFDLNHNGFVFKFSKISLMEMIKGNL